MPPEKNLSDFPVYEISPRVIVILTPLHPPSGLVTLPESPGFIFFEGHLRTRQNLSCRTTPVVKGTRDRYGLLNSNSTNRAMRKNRADKPCKITNLPRWPWDLSCSRNIVLLQPQRDATSAGPVMIGRDPAEEWFCGSRRKSVFRQPRASDQRHPPKPMRHAWFFSAAPQTPPRSTQDA